MLITVEGLDGAGKTTLITGLARALGAVVLREPGGVELSERIRALVADPALDVDPRAEALLYAAARAQLVAERLRPLLAAGETVLLDRFVDSSLAYQGGGRELGVEAVRALNAFATGDLAADRTLLLRIDPEQGLARIAGRDADRLEQAGGEFFARVAQAYDELAAADPARFIVLDAAQSLTPSSRRPESPVVKRALDLLSTVFANPAGGAPQLEQLRAAWPTLAPEERAALTPLAKLAAERVKAAPKDDGDGYWASFESEAPPEEEWSAESAGIDGGGGAWRDEADAAASGAARPQAPASGGDAAQRGASGGGAAGSAAPPANGDLPDWRRDLEQPARVQLGAQDQLAFGAAPAPTSGRSAAPAAPRPARAPSDATPESLLSLLGLSTFRPGQKEAVQAALDGRDALVVMPTGGGKSLCYQLPALATDDLTVVVSPLIALMRDQCQRLTDLGHPAVMLASGEDNQSALEQLRNGRATIVFAAPERFASTAFRNAIKQRTLALFVVDEAHCVSEWGHDFRPDYLRLASVIAELGHPPTMACTATATPKVAEEIVARLGLRQPERVRSGFDRPNLSFDVLPFDGDGSVARKRATLVAGLKQDENRPGVVYCGTRKSTEEIAALLQSEGLKTAAYHAGMPADARTRAQDAFMHGAADVVVATNAFGMGVDKADVRSVWHWALPSSLEAYYQEAGRAGRDGAAARAVLLASRSDLGRLVRFIREAEVTVEQVGALVSRLSRQGDLEFDAGDDKDRILLAIAERAGALTLQPGSGNRIRVHLNAAQIDRGKVSQLCRAAADRRWQSYRSIEHYAATGDRCRRRQLLDHFGDSTPGRPTGRCCDVHDPPTWLPPISASPKKLAPVEDGPPVSDDALAPLKAWRRERAEGKPAYTVATDATLREVVRRQPKSEQELLQIKGIGASFVAKHAESLLELLETAQ